MRARLRSKDQITILSQIVDQIPQIRSVHVTLPVEAQLNPHMLLIRESQAASWGPSSYKNNSINQNPILKKHILRAQVLAPGN